MKIDGRDYCIGCMHKLDEDGRCSYCHTSYEGYISHPRCLLPGTEIADRYVLGRVLGEGSFGITYIGIDKVLEQIVAVKEFYPAELAGRDDIRGTDKKVYVYGGKEAEYDDRLAKFYEEAKVLSRFADQPSVVTVRDFFYENNTAYIVMSYIEGPSLSEYVKEHGPIDPHTVMELMRELLHTMAEVHATGIVHRDISPDNLLFDIRGNLVLIDFGAARIGNSEWTRSLTVMFKRGYSPEEQYRLRGKQGTWSDVYALCAVMYYMLTAATPVESIERMLGHDMVSLLDMDEVKLPVRIKKAIMKGLSVREDTRWQSIEPLMHELYDDDFLDEVDEISHKSMTSEEKSSHNKLSLRHICYTAGILALILCVIFIRKYLLSGEHMQIDKDIYVTPAIEAYETKPPFIKDSTLSEDIYTQTPFVTKTPDTIKKSSHTKYVVMRSVYGLTYKKAKKRIKKFFSRTPKYKIHRIYSTTVVYGHVIKQKPKAGQNIKKDKKQTITLWLSLGPKPEKKQAHVNANSSLDTAKKRKKKKSASGTKDSIAGVIK